VEASKASLRVYVETSVRTAAVLKEEENVTVRRVRSVITVERIWSAVVNLADSIVMHRKRLEYPKDAAFWKLSYGSQVAGSIDKPAYRVSRVSHSHFHH